MPTKRKRTRRLRGNEVIRPSILAFLETGDVGPMRRDNPWLLISVPLREIQDAYDRGDLAAVRAILARPPAAHNHLIRG